MTIFISHSTENDPFVNKLQTELNLRGYRTWVDHVDMPVGSDWDVVVEHALEQCSEMILVLSQDAVVSTNVKAEWSEFKRLNKPIFPLKVTDCPTPLLLRMIHHVSFIDIDLNNNTIYIERLNKLLQSLPKQVPDEHPITATRSLPMHLDRDTIRFTTEQIEATLHTQELKEALSSARLRHTKPLGEHEATFIVPEFTAIIDFDLSTPLFIGRSSTDNKFPPDIDLSKFQAEQYGISRQHAMIAWTTWGVTLTDLGSLNGTFVGRRLPQNRLTAKQPKVLPSKSLLYFGQLAVQIDYGTPTP